VTENRQYRFWDKNVPEDVADKLVVRSTSRPARWRT
jgi:hypothetical protein